MTWKSRLFVLCSLFVLTTPLAVSAAPQISVPVAEAPAIGHTQVDPVLIDLSTPAKQDAYLVSAGIDPATVVRQDSNLNYAGPNCPGPEWNCADLSAPVLQASGPGGTNQADCSVNPDCTVVQSAEAGGDNNITCNKSGKNATENQNCNVTQSALGSASNVANVVMSVDTKFQRGNPASQEVIAQTADQSATIVQSSEQGSNTVTVDQTINQTVETHGNFQQAVHDQRAHQLLNIDQDTIDGNQTATVKQLQDLSSKVTGPTQGSVSSQSVQVQNNTPDDVDSEGNIRPHIEAIVDQDAVTGDNHIDLDQDMNLNQVAEALSDQVTQVQGTEDAGGILANLTPDSEDGFSDYITHQDKDWNQESEELAGQIVQVQDDRLLCCIFGEGPLTPNVTEINQNAKVTASLGDAADQEVVITARAFCKDENGCELHQRGETNGDVQVNDRTGNSFEESVDCTETECEVDSSDPLPEPERQVDATPEDNFVHLNVAYPVDVQVNIGDDPASLEPLFFTSEGVGEIDSLTAVTDVSGAGSATLSSAEAGTQILTVSTGEPKTSAQCGDTGAPGDAGTGCDEIRVEWVDHRPGSDCTGAGYALGIMPGPDDPQERVAEIAPATVPCPASDTDTTAGMDPVASSRRTFGPNGVVTRGSTTGFEAGPFTVTALGATSSSLCDEQGNASLRLDGGFVRISQGDDVIFAGNPGPGTSLTLLDAGHAVMNVQNRQVSATNASGEVTSIKIFLNDGQEFTIAYASSGVVCSPAPAEVHITA